MLGETFAVDFKGLNMFYHIEKHKVCFRMLPLCVLVAVGSGPAELMEVASGTSKCFITI
jgi:hypothetical protein